VALSRDIVIRLLGDADSAVKAQKAAADAAEVTVAQYRKAEREHDRVAKAMETAARKQRAAMEDVGRGSMIAGGAIVAGLGMAVKASMNWESAWAGVQKTVNGSTAELAKLEQGLRGLARTLPATHEEIAGVAEAAGQLGVKTNDIVGFTRTMINLGETTNLSADQAATSLAQLMNVMGTAPKDVDRLGATLVALGNAGASTEADITNMASYITGSAKLIGASESDVLALSNAMTSMGINAERGGGVMTRVMQDIYSAVQSGGDQLDQFAKVAGVSSAQFAQQFREDPIRAIDSFIQGLNKVEQSGGNVVETLSGLGFIGTQDTAVLLQLKGAGDLLTESLDLGNKAWDQNTALVIEAAKRYDTTASKTEMARNAINDAAIEIGDSFLPVLASLSEGVADVAKWFADLPTPLQNAIGGLAGVAGVGMLVGGAFLLIAPRVLETYKAFQLLNTGTGPLAGKLGALGKAAGVATALAVLGTAVSALDDAMAPTPGTMEGYTKALLDMDGSVDGLDKRFRGLDAGLADHNITGFADAIKRLTDPSNQERLNDFGGALFNIATFGGAGTGEGAASRRRVLDEVNGLDQSLALMVQNGNSELAAKQFELMAAEAQKNGVSLAELKELFPGYEGALQGIDNDQKAATESSKAQALQTQVLAESLDGAAFTSLPTYAAALGLSEDATKALIEQSNALGASLGDFIDPLGTYTGLLQQKAQAEADAANATAEKTGAASKSWEDFKDSVHVTFDEYMDDLESQVKAQNDWQVNMLILSSRVSAGTLAELAKMGPQGAPLIADLVNRSDAELARLEPAIADRSQAAMDKWGETMTLAGPVLAAVGKQAGAGVVAELAAQLEAGTITVADIAKRFGINIAGGINPVLTSLGRAPITIDKVIARNERYIGGYVGDGDKYEPMGIVHGGEYVLTKEQTSRLGINRIEDFANNGYANGGFVTAADVPKPYSTAPYGAPISTAGDAVMQKEYDEAVAFLNANMATGGTAGSGSVGGDWQSIWNWVKARIPQATQNSTYRPGDPGYHGRGKAIDFGYGGVPGGNGSAGLALINRTLYDGLGSNLAELIYDGIGDDRPDLKNGKPLVYNAATRAEHHNHVHAATYDRGGPLYPGYTMAYNGTGKTEWVSRDMPPMAVGSRAVGAAAAPVQVTIEGATLSGTLDLGGGLEGRIQAVVLSSRSVAAERARYNR
jgi:TP901 family phage tail tape measure protein